MKLLLLLLVIGALFTKCSGLVQSPGMMVRVNRDGYMGTVFSLIDGINNVSRGFRVPDPPAKWIYHVFQVRVRNIVIDDITLHKNKTNVWIDPVNNVLSFRSWDLSMDARLSYRIIFLRENVKKSGWCEVWCGGGSFAQMLFSIRSKDNRPDIRLLASEIKARQFSFRCHGDLIDKFMNAFKDVFRAVFSQLVNDTLKKQVPALVAQMTEQLSRIPIETMMHGSANNFFVNYGIAPGLEVKPEQWRIPLLAQFWYKGHEQDRPKTVFPSDHPFPLEPPRQHLCVNVDTNLAFRSAVYAFNVSEQSVFHVGKVFLQHLSPEDGRFFTCNCLGDRCLARLVPTIRSRCKKNFIIGFEAVAKVNSDLTVVDEGLLFYGSGYSNFTILTPGDTASPQTDNNGEVTPLTVEARVKVLINRNLTIQNMTLRGSVKIFPVELTAITPIGKLPLHVVKKIWDWGMLKVVQYIVNKLLGGGIPLPTVEFIQFSNAQVHFNGTLFEMCSDFHIDFVKLLKPKLLHRFSQTHKHHHHQHVHHLKTLSIQDLAHVLPFQIQSNARSSPDIWTPLAIAAGLRLLL